MIQALWPPSAAGDSIAWAGISASSGQMVFKAELDLKTGALVLAVKRVVRG